MRTGTTIALCSVGLLLLAGCSGGGLPSSIELELPDGTVVSAEQGSGVPSLAEKSIVVYRLVGDNRQTTPALILELNENGSIESIADNTLAADVFGDELILDGARHNTTQSGLTYAAATYGAEDTTGGLAFEMRLQAYFAGLSAAHGFANATGEYVDEDTIEGTFTFVSEVTLLANSPIAEQGNQNDTFEFSADVVESN